MLSHLFPRWVVAERAHADARSIQTRLASVGDRLDLTKSAEDGLVNLDRMSAVSSPAGMSKSTKSSRDAYDAYRARGLKLNMQRGQPSDPDFDLSNGLLSAVGPEHVVSGSGIDLRNYPGGIAGLPEARQLFGTYLDAAAEQTLVWNNSSLELQGYVFAMLMLRGVRGGSPWFGTNPTIIVTTPGYDRHFTLLEGLGYSMVAVDMQPDGPDLDAVERLAADNADIRGILFVPTYSNPSGETISPEKARRLASLTAASPEFTIFADDAYRVHHLSGDDRDEPVNFVALCAEAGNPDRVFVFASTSKVTYAGAGLGFVASSVDNIKHLGGYLGSVSIGPNKVEQYRHVRFLEAYPGGIDGLMKDHASLIEPKFDAVDRVLTERLGDSGLARWSTPRGGYFISLDTTLPVATRVVELADAAGVSLTPAGATFPGGNDPKNSNIRLAPTRPELADVELAMEVVAVCIKLASEEYQAANRA